MIRLIIIFLSLYLSASMAMAQYEEYQRYPTPVATYQQPRTWEPFNKENSTCRGIVLTGRVKVVEMGADFKVRVTNMEADFIVKVLKIQYFEKPGDWYFVDGLPDFTIQYVTMGEDFSVELE